MGLRDSMNTRQPRATVSGSFRQHMSAVQDAVYELTDRGVLVLSPADPRVVDQFGDFVFVASDRMRSIGLVEDRHLAAIAASDFVWLVSPEGYIGPSAAMEIGYATAQGVPVLSNEVPNDLGFRRYVRAVSGIPEAVQTASLRALRRSDHSFRQGFGRRSLIISRLSSQGSVLK
jgi:hypothetical protein